MTYFIVAAKDNFQNIYGVFKSLDDAEFFMCSDEMVDDRGSVKIYKVLV